MHLSLRSHYYIGHCSRKKFYHLRIVVIGLGTVGRSFCRLLQDRRKELLSKYGLDPRIVSASDTGGIATDENGLDVAQILKLKESGMSVAGIPQKGSKGKSGKDAIESVEAEVVVEATPTNMVSGEPALTHLETSIKTRKHVITANKGPLALAYPALTELASYNNVSLKFSAAVGGGTPVLEFGRRCLKADKILGIKGILNGTTNYILTEMDTRGISFEDALKEAKELGYAEADPTLDVQGFDSGAKLVIIANMLLDMDLTLKDLSIQGITSVSASDITAAKENGSALKLVASIEGKASVSPIEIKRSDPMCVSGVLNSVKFISEFAGEQVIIGKGAGGLETASAILRDLLDIRQSMRI
ncbi:MAG: homoserine dehydrogenase [Nitrososphaerales archaeon]